MIDEEQRSLLESLGLPTSFDGLDDDELMRIEDRLAYELQDCGINDAGDGLNDYGELCCSIIVSMPDD
jgi:hypothetical protein